MRFLPALALLFAAGMHAQLLPPNENGVTFGHVHLNVTDVEAQKKFWIEQFDAVPLTGEKPQLPGVKVPGMLILFTKKEPTHPSEGTVLDHFGFKVRNLHAMMDSIRAAGYEVRDEFKGTEGFPNAYVVGPDNVKVELQQDTMLTVKAVSQHLHYMIADPMALRTWYIDKLGLTATHRGIYETANAAGENFTFAATKKPPVMGTRGGSLDHIGLEVKNLEAYCRKLEANGIKLDVPYRKIPELGIAIAFITDPQGVYIELTQGLGAY
jgi:catechol 2,3-dioxygenase-like lactoylglutathione lyase family enzyme